MNRRITIQTGQEYSHVIKLQTKVGPVNITGATLVGKIRTFGGTDLVSFTCAVTDGLNGEALVSLTPVQTTALVGHLGTHEYFVYRDDEPMMWGDCEIVRGIAG